MTVAGTFTSSRLTSASSSSNTTFSGSWVIPAGGGELAATTSGTLTYSGVISGAGTLTLSPTAGGTVVLTGNNTFTGGATLTQGTLTLGGVSYNELGPAATSGALTLNGGSLRFGSSYTSYTLAALAGSADVTLANTAGPVGQALALRGKAHINRATPGHFGTVNLAVKRGCAMPVAPQFRAVKGPLGLQGLGQLLRRNRGKVLCMDSKR